MPESPDWAAGYQTEQYEAVKRSWDIEGVEAKLCQQFIEYPAAQYLLLLRVRIRVQRFQILPEMSHALAHGSAVLRHSPETSPAVFLRTHMGGNEEVSQQQNIPSVHGG